MTTNRAQDDLFAELATLEKLRDHVDSYAGDNCEDGVTLIHDDHFVEAMRDLVEDIGDLPNGMPSYVVVDWDATAENLRIDYMSVDFDGQTYWFR